MNLLSVIFQRFEDNLIEGFETTYTNINADKIDGNHLIINVMPAKTETIGVSSVIQMRGLIQVLVSVRTGEGAIDAETIGNEILALFPRNLELICDSGKIRFDNVGWQSQGFPSGAWFRVPVSIPYVITR